MMPGWNIPPDEQVALLPDEEPFTYGYRCRRWVGGTLYDWWHAETFEVKPTLPEILALIRPWRDRAFARLHAKVGADKN